MPETRNSSGMPHNDPHNRKTLNPTLGLGSFTNHDVPNTMAEWNTTSPATTTARATSSSGRRPAGREGTGREAAVAAAAGTVTRLATRVLPSADRCHPAWQSRPRNSSGHGRDFHLRPKADQQPPTGAHLRRTDDPAPQPSGRKGASPRVPFHVWPRRNFRYPHPIRTRPYPSRSCTGAGQSAQVRKGLPAAADRADCPTGWTSSFPSSWPGRTTRDGMHYANRLVTGRERGAVRARAGKVAACWHAPGFSRPTCGSRASQRGKDQFRSASTAVTVGGSALRITAASISSLGLGQFVGHGGTHRGLLGNAAGLLSAGCRSMAVAVLISSPVPSHRWTRAGGPVSRSTQSLRSPNAARVAAWIWESVQAA